MDWQSFVGANETWPEPWPASPSYGNLAAVTALRIRDEGGPNLAGGPST